jgi:hypothetical protein
VFIINLIGQPGAGKSVVRADVFARFKRRGQRIEEVTEFAKDLTYEERGVTLRCQPYIFGKQLRNLERLQGKVEFVVTDSPLLLCAYYNRKYREGAYPESFEQMVFDQYKRMPGHTFYLERVAAYETYGRSQNESESDDIGREIEQMLAREDIPYSKLKGDDDAVDTIEQMILGQAADNSDPV